MSREEKIYGERLRNNLSREMHKRNLFNESEVENHNESIKKLRDSINASFSTSSLSTTSDSLHSSRFYSNESTTESSRDPWESSNIPQRLNSNQLT